MTTRLDYVMIKQISSLGVKFSLPYKESEEYKA